MLKISDLSENCYKSELDLFSIPPTQVAIESGLWDTIYPISGYETNDQIFFRIPGDSLHYTDLSQTELCVGVEIVSRDPTNTEFMRTKGKGTDGGSTTDDQKDKMMLGYPANNFLHTLFTDIVVKFNNTIVEQTQAMYPYRAYLESLLNYDGESKRNFLQRQCFFKDEAGHFDNMTPEGKHTVNIPEADGPTVTNVTTGQPSLLKAGTKPLTVVLAPNTNTGGFKRAKFIKENGLMKGRFHLDTFQQSRYMLNGVDIDISMRKSKPDFCLIYKQEVGRESVPLYDIIFKKMYIKVRRVKISPSVMLAHAMELDKGINAKYPMKKVIVKPIKLEYNSTSQILSNVHHGIMPNRVVLAFTNGDAYTGTAATNPFNFEHFNMASICLKVASQMVPFSSPLEFSPMTVNKNDITEAYSTLFSGIRETSNDISIDEYKSGYFIFAFNLTPDLCSEAHYNILRDGNLEIVLRFEKIPVNGDKKPVTIDMITYLEFDNILEVTKSRNILVNYQ